MSLILIGAGGHAKVVYDSAVKSKLNPIGFIDDNVDEFLGLKKISENSFLSNSKEYTAIITFGAVTEDAAIRRHNLYLHYKSQEVKFISALDPTASISSLAKIGGGVVIFPNAVVNASSQIEENVIINTAAVIEHDVKIGAGSHICPGAMVLGGAEIGNNCIIGAGAVILPYNKVEASTLVPALTRFPK